MKRTSVIYCEDVNEPPMIVGAKIYLPKYLFNEYVHDGELKVPDKIRITIDLDPD